MRAHKEGVLKVARVCATEQECKLLHEAIADFTSDGPRARYVQWLAATGENERSRLLNASLQAYRSLDASPLQGADADDHWARMIGAPLLRAFIEAGAGHNRKRLVALRDNLIKRLRPALHLSYKKASQEPRVGTSYLWGLPDIPTGEAWPKTVALSDWFHARTKIPQDLHCAFLGQFAFEEMRGTVLGEELPREGGFAVFSITEVNHLGVVETLIRPWNNRAVLERRQPPPDLLEDKLGDTVNAPKPFHVIELTEEISLPDVHHGAYASEVPGCGFQEPFHDVFEALEDCTCGVLGFGGYLTGTSGEDPSPDARSLRFAVLRTSPEAGRIHFSIPAHDLEQGRLDRARYVWNDWDS